MTRLHGNTTLDFEPIMTQFLEYISTWSILKWVILVLIAGFIGQFGKMAANAIAAKIRARHQILKDIAEIPIKPSVPESSVASPSAALPDKKLLKAITKAKKKEGKRRD